MTELLTAAQMRAIEQAAIASGEVTGLELMERAGAGVVEAIFEEWPELGEDERRAVVLCGPGNNGGDGFVVARLLKERGWAVEVFLYGDEAKLPPDAAENCRRWREMGEVRPFSECFSDRWIFQPVVVDSIFGTGLVRAVADEIRNILLATLNCRRVAVDFPSFVETDNGRLWLEWPTEFVAAHITVTFHRKKMGHVIGEAPRVCGKIITKNIGIEFIVSEILPPEAPALTKLVTGEDYRTASIAKQVWNHKYTHGHAHFLAGPSGRGGAARLAARGALRIGAGLVTVGCPAAALGENAAQLNAIMVRAVDGAAGLTDLLDSEKIAALCLGPGLGLTEATKELVEVAMKSGVKCVLDADGLSIYQNNENVLVELLHENVVLTPHAGEFKRLFPDIAAKLTETPTKGPAYSKVDATREAAKRAGCVVLFKGADTVIADPDGRCSINSAHYERAAPWLATAGSGDVLAGFIAGLMARGFAPMQAAETAAWLHVECALSFGPGLIAEDLPEELPKVFRTLQI